jgi:hypothetical protein
VSRHRLQTGKKHNCSLDHSGFFVTFNRLILNTFMHIIYANMRRFKGIKDDHVSDDMALFSVNDVVALNTYHLQ